MKDRLDKMLVTLGLATTRSQALNFIKTGAVYESGVRITKPSYLCSGENLEIRAQTHYVGRGALKLLDALEHFDVDIKDKIAADIGASTGGFTQVLVEKGASKVYAIDVGSDQLDERVKSLAPVIELSKTNIRDVQALPDKIQVMVSDLSFISLELVLPTMKNLLADKADMVVLVKPQFEVGRSGLDKNGLVKSDKNRLEALYRVYKVCEELELGIIKATRCSITGKTGNQEYLYWLKTGEKSKVTLLDLEELSR
tara:strand:- start:2962 stop:3726 length:765 start_codon:yes stop_codon:yes gene_type:complete